jgi:glycine/D-amino acid oxidase-like deaminating enzyme
VRKRRVAIVGAGVLGLFTALELVQDGQVEVHVLETEYAGTGSSGRSVGMIETQYLTDADVEVRAFGRTAYSRLEHEHELHFVHGGYLRLGHTDADVAKFEESLRLQTALGLNDAAILSAPDISERWPQLVTDDVSAGLFGSWDGYVDGYEVSQLLSRVVRAAGGHVHTNTRLIGATQPATWRLETTNGMFEADIVVNAAGAWGGVVADMLGAPVALVPQLHGAVTVELPAERAFTPFVMDYVPGSRSRSEGVYFRSERKDQLIAGLHTEEVTRNEVSPNVRLGKMDYETIERVASLLAERLHDVDDIRIGNSWTGIYPMSSDHKPIVGHHSENPSVVCALCAGGNGIQLSPAIGRMAADAILGRPATFSPAVDWSHDRFSVASSNN